MRKFWDYIQQLGLVVDLNVGVSQGYYLQKHGFRLPEKLKMRELYSEICDEIKNTGLHNGSGE